LILHKVVVQCKLGFVAMCKSSFHTTKSNKFRQIIFYIKLNRCGWITQSNKTSETRHKQEKEGEAAADGRATG